MGDTFLKKHQTKLAWKNSNICKKKKSFYHQVIYQKNYLCCYSRGVVISDWTAKSPKKNCFANIQPFSIIRVYKYNNYEQLSFKSLLLNTSWFYWNEKLTAFTEIKRYKNKVVWRHFPTWRFVKSLKHNRVWKKFDVTQTWQYTSWVYFQSWSYKISKFFNFNI